MVHLIKADFKDEPVKEVTAVLTMENKVAGSVCIQSCFIESRILVPTYIKREMVWEEFYMSCVEEREGE